MKSEMGAVKETEKQNKGYETRERKGENRERKEKKTMSFPRKK